MIEQLNSPPQVSANNRCISLILSIVVLSTTGCHMLERDSSTVDSVKKSLHDFLENDSKQKAKLESGQVANPPAKTIRFDGNEIVLGRMDVATISQDQFESQLRSLLSKEHNFSAARLVRTHLDTAEHVLWMHWAKSPTDPSVQFIARIWDEEATAEQSWTDLLELAARSPIPAQRYANLRVNFVQKLQSELPTDSEAAALQKAAQALPHPLPQGDSLQLLAIRELMQEKFAWAKSLFQQSQEVASRNSDHRRASSLGLMVAATETKMGDSQSAAKTWVNTVHLYSDEIERSSTNLPYLGFWRRAIEIRPANTAWPQGVATYWQAYAAEVGVRVDEKSAVELSLWTGFAHSQFERGEYQKALIHFNEAESSADKKNKLWLQIAESNCLNALGQGPAAAAVLSSPIASDDETISAAATAALGSAKLKEGSYQLGAQLLNKSLNEAPSAQWPGRLRAEADLALVKLIIGDTEQGLDALHTAQSNFERAGDTYSLIRSLENEARISKLENRHTDNAKILDRIAKLERSLR